MRLRLQAARSTPAALALARGIGVPIADARALLRVERVLPFELDEATGAELAKTLQSAGIAVEVVHAPPNRMRCDAHLRLSADYRCGTCGRSTCCLCVDDRGEPFCAACQKAKVRRLFWKRVRLVPLVAVLASVALFSIQKNRERDRGIEWNSPLRVGVTLVSTGPLPEGIREVWEKGMVSLSNWVAAEAERYAVALPAPIAIRIVDVQTVAALPFPPKSQGAWLDDRLAEWKFRSALQELTAADTDSDIHLIVALSPPEGRGAQFVEGAAVMGGRVGLVQGFEREFDISLELIAAAHEIFHCFGAADAYTPSGHAMVPQGLVDPFKSPPYPQTHAEVMVGEIPTAPSGGRGPTTLDEVRVGPETARQIHWLAPFR